MSSIAQSAVLIVDDDATVVDMFVAALRANGYTALSAANGEEALECVDRASAVIVDFRMPTLDGLGFVRRLRERDSRIPVAVVTGDYLIDSAVLEQFEMFGARVVFKPVWLDQLVELATELLGGHTCLA